MSNWRVCVCNVDGPAADSVLTSNIRFPRSNSEHDCERPSPAHRFKLQQLSACLSVGWVHCYGCWVLHYHGLHPRQISKTDYTSVDLKMVFENYTFS